MVYLIGDLAKDIGVRADTIRYYEKMGLLPVPGRTSGGARSYTVKDKDRLHFIRRAKSMGFTLEEIRKLLELREALAPSREEARALAKKKMADVEARIADLSRLYAELQLLVNLCSSASGGTCPIIDGIRAPSKSSES